MIHADGSISLILPNGYGKGTIIYDLDGQPFEAKELLKIGLNAYRVMPVDKEYALAAIRAGAEKLISTK